MARRKKLSKKGSKRLFKATADNQNVNKLNMKAVPMRGGFRI